MSTFKKGDRVRTSIDSAVQCGANYTEQGKRQRRPDEMATVMAEHDSHGLCYEVAYDKGGRGTFEPHELTLLEPQDKHEVENVRINSTWLGFEDHGLSYAAIFIQGAGWTGAFGTNIVGDIYTHRFVSGVLRALGLDRWEDLPNTLCRVRKAGHNEPMAAIGHIVEDRWFAASDMERECPRHKVEMARQN